MKKRDFEYLVRLRIELESIESWSWSNLEQWNAKATPLIKSSCPEFFAEFIEITKKPRAGLFFAILNNNGEDVSNAESFNLGEREKYEQSKLKMINFLSGIEEVKGAQFQIKSTDAIEVITTLCHRFLLVARELKHRRSGREPLQINDEYDVQYLLHALLKVYFDDVRPEEWTPSYAGASARMDFLLKTEKIVIEAKMTRQGLNHKEVGEQLLIDIEKYVNHADCETLVCFVYDPENRINNPRGLENDLSRHRENLVVTVIIV